MADAEVSDLSVTVKSPAGVELAADHGGDRWPILNPDGPFCATATAKLVISVRSRRGRGRYALQVWKLP